MAVNIQEQRQLQLVIVGDAGTGKTNFITRYDDSSLAMRKTPLLLNTVLLPTISLK